MLVPIRNCVFLFTYIFLSHGVHRDSNAAGRCDPNQDRCNETELLTTSEISHNMPIKTQRIPNILQYDNTGQEDNKRTDTKKMLYTDEKKSLFSSNSKPFESTRLTEEPKGIPKNQFQDNIHIIYLVTISILMTWKYFNTHQTDFNDDLQKLSDPKTATDHLQAMFDAINVGVIATNNQMRIIYMNATAAKMCGWNANRAIGKPVADVARLVTKCNDRHQTDTMQNLQEDALMLQTVDGRYIHVRHSVSPLTVHNQVTGLVMLLQDMTMSREMIKKLSHSAAHDALTGLPNRTSFERRLHTAINNCIEYSTHHALAFLDLDGFKKVNDTFGHAAGDVLLIQVAKLMQCQLRCGDFLARLGGDEFGIVLFDCSLNQAKHLIESLVKKIGEHEFYWEGKMMKIGASAGITGVSDETRSVGELVARADAACYTAKSRGKGQAFIYNRDVSNTKSKSSKL